MIPAPIGGVLEWRVEPGTPVAQGAVLGWIAGPGRCGLIPLVAPTAGTLTWRRAPVLEVVYQGEPSALIDGDAEALLRCQTAERDAARRALEALELELATLSLRTPGPLAEALLGAQRAQAEQRRATLRGLLDRGD